MFLKEFNNLSTEELITEESEVVRRTYFKTLLLVFVFNTFPFLQTMENSLLRKILLLFFSALLFPVALYRAAIFTIPYIELAVTSYCNLNCEGCSNLMNYYTKKEHVPIEELKKSVNTVLSVSKRINILKLIGGEPFLYPDFSRILNFALSKHQIKSILITTNASVLPDNETIFLMKNRKVTVLLSEYAHLNQMPFVKMLTENEIKYKIIKLEKWVDFGNLDKRNHSEETLIQSYNTCAVAECKTLYNGKFYSCPRSAHGDKLGYFEEEVFGDLSITDRKKLKKSLKNLFITRHITACDYCNSVNGSERIPVAKQRDD